jgi:hypothetical protein
MKGEGMTGQLGRVVKSQRGLPHRLVFPDSEHEEASSFLRDLSASDCSPATLRSYAYDLLRWFRFLHEGSRHDPNEKIFSDPLPHLFARLVGSKQNVLSQSYIGRVLNGIAAHAGLMDAGSPVTFTPARLP